MNSAAIIIPHHNDEARLALLLESIRPQLRGLLSWAVFVVDDASRDPAKCAAVCQAHGARFLNGTGGGSYSARNLGIAAAGVVRGLVFTDSDCIFEPGTLAAYEAWLLGTDPRLLAAGPIALFPRVAGRPNRWEYLDMVTGLRQEHKVKQEQVAVTANLAVRAEGFARFGAFNEQFRSGGDIEFTRRLGRTSGGIAWLDGAKVLHPARASRDEHLTKMRRVQRGTLERGRRGDGKVRMASAATHLWQALRPPVDAWFRILRARRGSPGSKLGAAWAAVEQKLARTTFVTGFVLESWRSPPLARPPQAKDRPTTA